MIKTIDLQDQWGDVPATCKERILSAQIKKINWRNVLRRFLGNLIWNEKESTRKRPNRRTGFLHPGTKKTCQDKHLVAIDTSGSTQEYLPQFLGVINQMVDYLPIDIMQFDCEKTEDPKPFDRRKKNYEFTGFGGTNFEPVMQIVKERKYKSVVIVTDGEAPTPSKPKAKVVWVLPQGKNPPVDWGTRIHMSHHV
jgi:predicted metal-dependent peptidase